MAARIYQASVVIADVEQSGVNGLLDVARQTYKEAMEDAYQHVTRLGGRFNII
jgi:hypothetical protein